MAAKAQPAAPPAGGNGNAGVHLPLGNGNNEHGGWRVDPPGQVDNEHSNRPDAPPGQIGKFGEDLTGTGDDNTIVGGLGNDTLDGQGGNDHLTGGRGADKFVIGPLDVQPGEGENPDTIGNIDTITDFNAADGDKIAFGFVGDANYDELTLDPPADPPADYDPFAAAKAAAEAKMGADQNAGFDYVSVQVGDDVIVFADLDGDGTADSAVVLAGATLDSVGAGDFV